ncbi:HEPN domain-containing protein [Pseudoxanthomonas daejeonensis]|uniref:RiboL-PSP-HEPN domain-containing protein n=1 Tax=Pseudoxanthomonas daejeonensis TaxID=266062 RepID=A0ABQ6Z7R6_9GAMM|nr:HEPN domain-containing protein [Pseudoxanthomonas daejeonensis]KAF1695043.1 hypothetical protein CSC65_07450 [Pseudoxanthomonas daejeonensis]
MPSKASLTFDHAIQDAVDLVNHFDKLNTQPPPPENEVLKRASLVMALAALETYFEDRLVEAVETVAGTGNGQLAQFMRDSLSNDLKYFHTPSTDRVRPLFQKYLGVDITESWKWNMMEPAAARTELNALAKKRGDIAHRSWRPASGTPTKHAVSRDDLRRHIHFIRQVVLSTDAVLAGSVP